MSKTSRIVSVILVLSILLSFGMTAVAADEALHFSITSLEVVKDEKIIGSMQEGALTVRATLKAEEARTPLIMALLCNGEEDYYNVASSSYVDDIAFAAGEEKTVEIPLSCTDKNHKFIKVMVFDSYGSMHLEAESAIFPTGKEAMVKSVSLNGEAVKGFEQDTFTYNDIQVPYATALPLDIKVETVVSGANVTIEQPSSLPGTLVIKSSFEGGETFTYTFQLTEGRPVVVDYYGGWEAPQPFDLTVIDHITETTKRYSDQDAIFRSKPEFPSELIGATYLQPNYESTSKNADYLAPAKDWLTFTIQKPATVYYLTTTSLVQLSYQNFLNNWLKDGWAWMTTDGQTPDVNGKNAWILEGSTSWTKNRLLLVKKEIDASVENPVTIKMLSMGSGGYQVVSSVAIQWKDAEAENSLNLSGITVGGKALAGFASDTTEYSNVEVESLDTEIAGTAVDSAAKVTVSKPASLPGDATITVEKDGKSRVYTLHLIPFSTEPKVTNLKSGVEGYTANLIKGFGVGTQRWSDYNASVIGWNHLDGLNFNSDNCYYIQTQFNNLPEGYKVDKAEGLITFDINKSANVYILYHGTWVGDSKYFPGLSGWELMKKEDGTNYRLTTNHWGTNGTGEWASYIGTAFLYKKSFVVPSGTTQEISLTYGGTSANYNYNVIVEFTDGVTEQTNLNLSGITVGGKALAGFAADTTEYSNVEVESLDTEIAGTAVDSAAQVTVTKPASLPGDATITVEKDGKSKVYTLHLSLKAGKEKEIVITKNPSGWTVAENVTAGNGGTQVYCDQNTTYWNWGGLNLDGATAIQTTYADAADATCTSKVQQTWASFTINQSADIYVLSIYQPTGNYMKWLTTDGYEIVNGQEGNPVKVQYSNSISKTYFLHKKTVSVAAGNTEQINLGVLGPNGDGHMYAVLVNWIDNSCDLSSITVDGKALASFAADTMEYSDVEVGSLDTEIAGTAVDSAAKVTVTKPSSLPGDATITVEKVGKSKVYTLHLIQKKIETKAGEVTNIQTKASVAPNLLKGFGSGTRRWQQNVGGWQNYVFEDLDGFSVGSENSYYLQTSATQESDSGFNQDISEGWLSFDINRSANIYVLLASDTFGNATRYPGLSGWEKLKKENGDFYCMYTANCPSSAGMTLMKGGRAYIYKKSFTLPSDGLTTQNISLSYGGTSPYGGYNVIVEFTDAE